MVRSSGQMSPSHAGNDVAAFFWDLGSLIEGLARGHVGGACARAAGPLATGWRWG